MPAEPLRLALITDSHVVSAPGAGAFGVDAFAALEKLLPRIWSGSWAPRLLVHTGDLVDDYSAASYRRLRTLLASLEVPVHSVPGNHDDPAEMRASFYSGSIRGERVAVYEPWQFVFLDSTVRGADHGHLAAAELAALDEALRAAPELHTLVFLHHGPFPVCPLPLCQLDNAGELCAVLGRHSNVRGVLSGHNHCAVDEPYGGVRMLVTPSTCVQFEHPAGPVQPSDQFAQVHKKDPSRQAWRRLELYPDGEVVTEVVWGESDR
jgi:Icc protein